MNKNAKSWIIACSLIAISLILIAGIVFAKPSAKALAECKDNVDNDGDGLTDWPSDPGCSSKNDKSELGTNECDDGTDNDGDGDIDTADGGCASAYGTDESDCGDSVCEGNETSQNCPQDCGEPDSCSDSDGGIVIDTLGDVSGYSSGSPYTYTDFCLENDDTLIEFYCSGEDYYNMGINCSSMSGNFTACSQGACV